MRLVFRKLETRTVSVETCVPYHKIAGGSDLCHDSGLGKMFILEVRNIKIV